MKADGKVEDGNTKIVRGNTVYHETHVKNDGNYVKKDNSAGDNLTILDKQVGNNTTNITNLGNTINNLNGKLGTLDNRIKMCIRDRLMNANQAVWYRLPDISMAYSTRTSRFTAWEMACLLDTSGTDGSDYRRNVRHPDGGTVPHTPHSTAPARWF